MSFEEWNKQFEAKGEEEGFEAWNKSLSTTAVLEKPEVKVDTEIEEMVTPEEDPIAAAAKRAMSGEELPEQTIPKVKLGDFPIEEKKFKFAKPEPARDFVAGFDKITGPKSSKLMQTIGRLTDPTTPEGAKLAKEIIPRLSYYKTALVAPVLGRILDVFGQVDYKNLQKELKAEREKFSESDFLGEPMLKASEETAQMAFEWGWLYPKLYKLAGLGGNLINKIPQVAKYKKVIEGMGGVQKFAKANPRIYEAGKRALTAFPKGYSVGATTAGLESIGEDREFSDWLSKMNKRGLLIGGVATTFSLAQSRDIYKHVKKVRTGLNKVAEQRVRQRLGLLKGTRIKGTQFTNMFNQELAKIDDVVSTYEAELFSGKELYGQKLSTKKAIERLTQRGYYHGQPQAKGVRAIKGVERFKVGQGKAAKGEELAAKVPPKQPRYSKYTITVTDADGTKREIPIPTQPKVKAKPLPGAKEPYAVVQVIRDTKGAPKGFYPKEFKISGLPKDWTVSTESMAKLIKPVAPVPVRKEAEDAEQKQKPAQLYEDVSEQPGEEGPEIVREETGPGESGEGVPERGQEEREVVRPSVEGEEENLKAEFNDKNLSEELKQELRQWTHDKEHGALTSFAKDIEQDKSYYSKFQQHLKDRGLPEKVTVYKGVEKGKGLEFEKYSNATISKDIAKSFAEIAGVKEEDWEVKAIEVSRKDIIAYADEYEDEIIIRKPAATEKPKARKPVEVPKNIRKLTDKQIENFTAQVMKAKSTKKNQALLAKLNREYSEREKEKTSGVKRHVRYRKRKAVEEEIKKTAIYEAEAEAQEISSRQIGPGLYYVPPELKGDVYDIIGKPKGKTRSFWTAMQKMFVFEPTKGAIGWDVAVQQGLLKNIEGQSDTSGEMDISEFVRRVQKSIEGDPLKSTLEKLTISDNPYDLALFAQWEMWQDGSFSEKEVDEAVKKIHNKYKEFTDEQESKRISKGAGEEAKDIEGQAERAAIQKEQEAPGEVGDFLEGIEGEKPAKATETKRDLVGTPFNEGYKGKQLGIGLEFEVYKDRVPPTDVPTKVALQNAVIQALNDDAQKILKSKRKYKGLKDEKDLYEKQFKDKPELFINLDNPIPEMRAAWTIATKGKSLFGMEGGGGAGGSMAAPMAAGGGGYGTIANSEKDLKQPEKTNRRAFRAALPEKMTPIEGLLNIGRVAKEEVLDIASPAHKTDLSRAGARTVRRRNAELARKDVIARELLKKAHHAFTFMSRADVLEFIDKLENGQQQRTPRLEHTAYIFRKLLDQRREQVQGLGKGFLENFYENYFPHMWKDPSKAARVVQIIMGKRNLQGPKSFLKKRSLITVKDGIEAGLEPISYNPVDIVLLKLHEIDRFLMAHRIIGDLKAQGLIKFVYARSKAPEGYRKVDDRAFTVYMPPELTKKEAYDQVLVDKLMEVARSLGIDVQRFVSIGGKRWGYAKIRPSERGITETKGEEVRTKFAGPEFVLAHEISHVIGNRYDVWKRLGRRGEGTWRTIKKGEKAGQKVFKPAKEAVEYRKDIDKEWRALADLQYKGFEEAVSKGFKKYVRKKVEKEAILLEALIHAPTAFKKVAPKLHKQFTAFLNSQADLRPLLDIESGLVLGVSEAKIKVPGFTVLGHYYAPKDVSKVLNNFLSPGLRGADNKIIAGSYSLLRMAGNVLNQAQLSLSLFHGLNVTTDIMASTYGLGLREITEPGQMSKGLLHLTTWPLAPVSTLWQGTRLKKAFRREMDQIKDPKLQKMVQAVVFAGGRNQMDTFYYNQSIKHLKASIGQIIHGSAFQKVKSTAALPWEVFGATLEGLAYPLMQWYVPTGKLGLFSKMAQSELKRHERGKIDDTQLWEQLTQTWDSVDNRMGQLSYDNLFWNKLLKDLSMLAVRSVGWNLGSWREFGGIPIDILTTFQRIKRGDKVISRKMGYGMGCIVVYGTIGAVAMYLMTGQSPKDLKDYFFPKTGETNPDGTPERLSFPTYVKDWFAYGTQFTQTIKNKLHPLWSLLADLTRNKNFMNVMVRNPQDPWEKQAKDVSEYIGRTFLPISIQNFIKMQKTSKEKGKNLYVSLTGITSAPAYITRTPAQKLAYRYIIERIPDKKARTKESFERNRYRKVLKNRIRKGEPVDMQEAKEVLGARDLKSTLTWAKKEPFEETFDRLSFYEALNVYAIANADERRQAKDRFKGKHDRARLITPEMEAMYKELIKD